MPTFYDRFVECSERWPRNVALEIQRTEGVESYTYAELRRMAEAFAAWLLSQGMPPASASRNGSRTEMEAFSTGSLDR